MHPLILGSALWALAATAALAQVAPKSSACPRADAPVHEAFVRADCIDCWATADVPGKAGGWRFDWLVPAAPDAPMAAAALPEAADRAARAASATLARHPPRMRPGQSLRVASGPAWKGYFGVQVSLQAPARQPWPAGATAWLALVEQVPAGSDGSPLARSLVRAVAGPLPVGDKAAGQPLRHLRAMRWPDAAQPTRLQARGWIEDADGRMLAVAADHCP